MSTAILFKPIDIAQTSPKDLDALERIQSALVAPHFTSTDAWEIGCALRERLLHAPKPCVISITLPTSQPLFFCTTGTGTNLDNASWVFRKTKTVLRFSAPSYHIGVRFADRAKFLEDFGMGPVEAGTYSFHGGAVPIKVKGVEGVVAVVVVSGLTDAEDHGAIIEVLGEWLRGLKQ